MAVNRLYLVYNSKKDGTFESGRWGTTTSPDLYFISRDKNDQPLRAFRFILQTFLQSQHKPVVMNIEISLLRINKHEILRWNLRKEK